MLETKKKEIEEAYTAPYVDVQAKLDELIEMVKVPFKIADDFIKEAEKSQKKREILAFAKAKAAVLGEYADKITESPAFFNPRWLNTSYKAKQWQEDVESLITQASDDLAVIRSTAGKNAPALMSHYFQTLSMEQVFKMYSGDPERVVLEFDRSLLNPVYDKFGEEITVTPSANERLLATVDVQVSPPFFGWLAQFSDKMRIVSPPNVKERYWEHIRKILEK